MSNVLVISGHPNLSQSNTNQIILESLNESVDNIEIRRLDDLYPNYEIDIPSEQEALLAADIIVLQFPFYWYSVPALLKKWIDDVFSYDFAYGSKGDKLQDKDFILSFTIGGPKESYDPLGYNHFSIEQLVQPLQQTAYLAGMNFHAPVYSYGMVYIPNVYNELKDVQHKAKDHSKRLVDKLNDLSKVDEPYVERFARKWFKALDNQPKDIEQFTKYLTDDLVWDMPEGKFFGHHGFKEWYKIAQKTFKPGCDHQIQAISVTKSEEGFNATLAIQLTADTYSDSEFKGEKIKIVVNEQWQLTHSQSQELLISSYVVKAT